MGTFASWFGTISYYSAVHFLFLSNSFYSLMHGGPGLVTEVQPEHQAQQGALQLFPFLWWKVGFGREATVVDSTQLSVLTPLHFALFSCSFRAKPGLPPSSDREAAVISCTPTRNLSEASFHQQQSPPPAMLPPSHRFTVCSLTKCFPLLVLSMLIVGLIHYTSCKQSGIHQGLAVMELWVPPHTGRMDKASNCHLSIYFFLGDDCIHSDVMGGRWQCVYRTSSSN